MNIKPLRGGRRPSKHQYAANLASGCYRPCNRRPSYANPPSIFSFRPSLPPLPFVVSSQLDETKAPIKAADRRSRNPRAERRITCEARRRGYVSVSEKPVDHLRGSVKLEIICPFPSTIPGCLAIIGEHRRERASRKSQPEPRKGPKRTRANGGGEQEGNREREREKNRRRRREREFKEREREKRGMEKMKNREREEKEKRGGKGGKEREDLMNLMIDARLLLHARS